MARDDRPRQRVLYLHIGLPKTASTWLQNEVFPMLADMRLVSKPQTRLFRLPQDAEAGFGAFDCAMKRSSSLWDSYGDALFEEMLGPRQKWQAEDADLIVTDEAVGRAGSRPALLAAHVAGIAATAARWGMSRTLVLCVIRRQDHWLASHYAQVSDRARRPGQAGFEALVEKVLDPAQSRHEFGTLLDLDLLREALVRAVGPDGLLIVPQEALRDEPRVALGRILNWLGTSDDTAERVLRSALDRRANVRSQDNEWKLRRPTLRVPGMVRRVTLPAWPLAGGAGTISLRPELSAAILTTFGPGNRRLAAVGNLPLEQWGYFGANTTAADEFGAAPSPAG